MTLALSLITKDYIYQISDRRLTSLAPPHIAIDDEISKAIIYDGSVSISYAGLGQIGVINGSERVDDWIVRILSKSPAIYWNEVAEKIRSEATITFKKKKCSNKLKRHAFQCVGWFKYADENFHRAAIVTISNAMNPNTFEWLDEAKEEFEISEEKFYQGQPDFAISSIGQNLRQKEKNLVWRYMKKISMHKNTTPKNIVISLCRVMHWLSSNYEPNRPIGKSLTVVVLPRAYAVKCDSGEGLMVLMGGSPDSDSVYTYHISDTGLATQQFPHTVTKNGQVITRVTFTPYNE